MARKGELSVNILIVVALALLILIILVVLLGKGSRNLDNGLDCVQKGGRCTDVCNPADVIDAICPQQSSYSTNVCCKLVS